jgi:hypothetical protein
MKTIAANAERMSVDTMQVIVNDNEHNTTNKNLIQQSIERDDNNTLPNTIEKSQPQGAAAIEKPTIPAAAPVVNIPKPASSLPKTTAAPKKATTTTTPVAVKKPKAVMPKTPPKQQPVKKPAVTKQALKKPANDY